MSDRLHAALLDMADPARKLADALDEYALAQSVNLADNGPAIHLEPMVPHRFVLAAVRPIPEPHASILTTTTDRDILETLQGQADELLHAIDMARQNVQGAIPLQTLDLVRGKVKDVVANLAGTIEKDL